MDKDITFSNQPPPTDAVNTNDDIAIDAKLVIGPHISGFRGRPVYFLLIASICAIIQSAISNGVFPAIISSIELIYGFSSTQAGFILAFYDIVAVIAVVLIIANARNAHRPQWIAVGEAALAVGCIIAIIPAYTTRSFTAIGLFLLAQATLAIVGAPLYPLATMFIYENTPKPKISAYVGVFNAMTAVGLAAGFIVAGAFLHTSADYWPFAFVFFGILALAVAPFMYIIPHTLTYHCARSYMPAASFWSTFKSVITIPAYTCTQLGFSVEAIVVVGLANFLPKFCQIRFNFDPATASFTVGPLLLVAAVVGIIVGSLVSSRWPNRAYPRNIAACALFALALTPCLLISSAAIFIPIFFLLVAATMFINVPATLFCIRCINNNEHRALALAIGSALQRLLGATSGPIIVGAIIDSTCTRWDTACQEYDTGALAHRIFIFTIVLKSVSTAFFAAAIRYNPIPPYTLTPSDLHFRSAPEPYPIPSVPATFDVVA